MLVDKLIKRKIDLVDLLNDSNGLVIQEIQEKLNLTGKTIRTELKDLLLDCPYTKEEIAIEKIGSKYVLQTKETINIETIKTNLKKSSLLFQIYYAIFSEKFLITKDSSNDYKLVTTLFLLVSLTCVVARYSILYILTNGGGIGDLWVCESLDSGPRIKRTKIIT